MSVPGIAFPHEMLGYERDSIEGIAISVELINQYNKMQNDKATLSQGQKPGKTSGSGQARSRKISRGPQRSRMKHLPKTRKKK